MSFVVPPTQQQDCEIFWFSELLTGKNFSLDSISCPSASLTNDNGPLLFRYHTNEVSGSFQIVLPTHEHRSANGLGVNVEIGGWQQLSYIAVGFRDEKKYHHVKATNPRQGHPFNFCVSFDDLTWGWSNDWTVPDAREIKEIRFYIKGKPGDNAYCKIHDAWLWRESLSSNFIKQERDKVSEQLLTGLYNYQLNYFPSFANQAEEFLEKGTCPLAGNTQLDWSPLEPMPAELHEIGTYQYSWHALHPATLLMLNAQQKGCLSSLIAAREFVMQWITNSFDRPDPNKKYAWYDHGVAERVLALIFLYALGQKHQFDHRCMSRLIYTIYRHAQLLASEVFYACHQSTRYHNHAWFQDLALMVVAAAFPKWSHSASWAKLALERIEDQFEKLIIEEAPYAVFSENSFGYHLGIERLVSSIEYFSSLVNLPNNISTTRERLTAFNELLLFPDHVRGPAQGDTFRSANPLIKKESPDSTEWQSAHVFLPQSGYFIAKGGGPIQLPWLVTFLATNRNATHKHEDDLSLILWMDGIEWLIDPSFYSHEYADELPAFLRSARAHNMLHIPEVPYSYVPTDGRSELKGVQLGQRRSIIDGVNRSCENHAIYRHLELSENASGLPQIEVTDYFDSSLATEQQANGLLCFHFGDGIVLQSVPTERGLAFLLSHAASDKQLLLRIESEWEFCFEYEILPSWSGLGFLEKIETQRIQLHLPTNTQCKWSIYVV